MYNEPADLIQIQLRLTSFIESAVFNRFDPNRMYDVDLNQDVDLDGLDLD